MKTDTDINIIGGIPDYATIYDVLRMLSADVPASQIQKAVLTDNRYGIRTENSRRRFLSVIKSAFWQNWQWLLWRNIELRPVAKDIFNKDFGAISKVNVAKEK